MAVRQRRRDDDIEDGKTIVASPHKVYAAEINDLVIQLRKRGKSKVVLAGMLANLRVESHMRELIEQGFEVAVAVNARRAVMPKSIIAALQTTHRESRRRRDLSATSAGTFS